jgi:hypothetical protein
MTKYYSVFFKNKNPYYIFARLIEWVDGTDFSHVEIVKVVDDNWKDADSYGSVFSRSRKIKLSELKKHYEIKDAVELAVCVEKPDAILESLMGKLYSFLQILLTGVNLITKASISWLPYVKVNLSKALICTELAGIFMQEACQYKFQESPELLSVEQTRQIALKNLFKLQLGK